MIINSIRLKNYRNYINKEFSFDNGLNVIIGKNGAGKTNILEAIYVLSHGKSWRSRYDNELINHLSTYANISAQVNSNKLFVGLERTESKRTKKIFKVNNINKSSFNFVSNTVSVLFSPQDLDILIGSPSNRREFLDSILSQIDLDYRKNLLTLKKVVRQRNILLERIRERLSDYSEMYYWNQKLIESSTYIHNKRLKLIEYINEFVDKKYTTISNSNSFAMVEYNHSIASIERINKYKDAEVSSGRTLVGAHKDDLTIYINKVTAQNLEADFLNTYISQPFQDARYFASRGEQRTLVFVLKLASLEYIKKNINCNIILLLDDIYSELDEMHREKISEYFVNNQVLITSAEKSLIPQKMLDQTKIIYIS